MVRSIVEESCVVLRDAPIPEEDGSIGHATGGQVGRGREVDDPPVVVEVQPRDPRAAVRSRAETSEGKVDGRVRRRRRDDNATARPEDPRHAARAGAAGRAGDHRPGHDDRRRSGIGSADTGVDERRSAEREPSSQRNLRCGSRAPGRIPEQRPSTDRLNVPVGHPVRGDIEVRVPGDAVSVCDRQRATSARERACHRAVRRDGEPGDEPVRARVGEERFRGDRGHSPLVVELDTGEAIPAVGPGARSHVRQTYRRVRVRWRYRDLAGRPENARDAGRRAEIVEPVGGRTQVPARVRLGHGSGGKRGRGGLRYNEGR